jgi:hypothetical protein
MMYLSAIAWKANSGGSEDNPGSNDSMPGVDEPRIMFDNISQKYNLRLKHLVKHKLN